MLSEIYCVASGKVQGVGYRDCIEKYAREHGLCGRVCNRNDGTVEVLAQGTPDELKNLIEILNQGSPLARVEALSVSWRTSSEHYDEFKVVSV